MIITLQTTLGTVHGNSYSDYDEFLGIPYARAGRFEYAAPVDTWEDTLDATTFGPACPQSRTWFPHLEHPDRLFFYKEFREGDEFTFNEDCLNLNIWAPKNASCCPVMVYFHGGGFNSGSNAENQYSGANFARNGIVTVVVNYRVGVLGYLTHPDIQATYGRDGNFGLFDQVESLKWVQRHIADFGGDPSNITVAGQSAGAMSIQYLCCTRACQGLFRNALMMSGAGQFPSFALPRLPENTHAYWQDFMNQCGVSTLDELRKLAPETLFTVLEDHKRTHKDNTYNTMPVIDGQLLTEPIQTAIKTPLPVNYMLGYTNCDMFAPALAFVNHSFSRHVGGYLYFFDVNPKGGDGRKAFHSADLRYWFGTLERSWRPYDANDQRIAALMQSYALNFIRTGNPNGKAIDGSQLPEWKRGGAWALHFAADMKLEMTRAPYLRLLDNMLHSSRQV